MAHVVETDFNSIKASLRTYLEGRDEFKDFNFEGSNLSALLDLLSYNTYLNSLYVNMAFSEMFLDTAQTIESVRSHSKELNYLPRSRRSAKATVTLTVTPSNTQITSVSVPKGTTMTASANNQSFTFVTSEATTISSSTGVFSANIDIYEGSYKSEFYTKNTANVAQRFLIEDNKIDTDSLVVTVKASESSTNTFVYTYASDLFGLTPTSNVYFLSTASDGRYEIIFGNGITGRALSNENFIEANYRISSGANPNGANAFTPGTIDGHSNTSAVVANTSSYARGGSVAETLSSIKFNAPRHYQTLQRAVTASDYRNLILAEFPQIQALSVYGGEEMDPPRYGSVIISADVANADGISESLQQDIIDFVSTKSPLSIDAVFEDPKFLEVAVTSTVRYNTNLTTQTLSDIQSKVRTAILNFNTNNLVDFNKVCRYSRLLAAIDAADDSIIGNNTEVRAIRKISPIVGVATNYNLEFNNALVQEHLGPTRTDFVNFIPAIKSSTFIKGGQTCYIEDDSDGILDIVTIQNNERLYVQRAVGTVNYTTGVVTLTDFVADSYTGDGIKIYGTPVADTIRSAKNLILQISSTDINLTVVQERE